MRTTPVGGGSEPPVPPPPPVESLEPEPARPRRKPMVEVAGPRRAQVVQRVPTLTVDIPVEAIVEEPPPPPPQPVTPGSIDVPWYAEDIERLPEANVDLGQLSLESLETLPPLPLRLDAPRARPPGPPASQLQGK